MKNYSINELPNTLTANDLYTMMRMTFDTHFTVALFDETGRVFNVDKSVLVINDADQTKVVARNSINIVWTEDSYHIENNSTYEKYGEMSKVSVFIDEAEEETKLVDLKHVNLLPKGPRWEQYKRELAVVPMLKNGTFNIEDPYVREMVNMNGYGVTEYFENTYLICHTKSLTSTFMTVSKDGSLSFNTLYLTDDYNSDSLTLALALPFDWAMTECS